MTETRRCIVIPVFGEDLVDELTTGAPTDEKRNARARTILKALELEEYAEQHPATLSGGQKQRLALGVALSGQISRSIS